MSCGFPVFSYCKESECKRNDHKGQQIFANIVKSGALEHYHPVYPDEICHWVYNIKFLGPLRHAFERGKNSAHEYKNYHKEKGNEHILLLC